MDSITVNKKDLLVKLGTNREAHAAIYEKAAVAYRAKVIEALDRALEDAKKGNELRTYIRLPVPEDHTEEFDRAIEMLTWDTGDEVVLSEHEFREYVQNQWGWAASFAANTQSYVAS